MDLKKILGQIEGSDELIKQIEAEVGKEFVPRTEFNSKNAELKNLEKQLGELNVSIESLNKDKATHDKTVADLNGKISGYESAAMKARIAHESGLPYELWNRLAGDDEKAMREDAAALSKLIDNKSQLTPLKDTEKPSASNTTDAALLEMAKGLRKGE